MLEVSQGKGHFSNRMGRVIVRGVKQTSDSDGGFASGDGSVPDFFVPSPMPRKT